MAPSKFLLGVLATSLIAIGVAAQTGTVHVATPAKRTPGPAVTHGVVAAQAPRPQVVQPATTAPLPPPPAAAPVQGDGEGDGGGD